MWVLGQVLKRYFLRPWQYCTQEVVRDAIKSSGCVPYQVVSSYSFFVAHSGLADASQRSESVAPEM